MQNPTDKQPGQPKKGTSYNNYLRYSGLAFQMLGAFLALVLGGKWLDGKLQLHFPAFTLIGALLAMAWVFYTILLMARNSGKDT